MAEGFARTLKRNEIDAYSAGVEPHGINKLAVKAMAEAGVDISRQRSKHVDELRNIEFDYVVTVCGRANETCPAFGGKTRRLHVGFDDPPALAKCAGADAEPMTHYRRVRDQIRRFIEQLPDSLTTKEGTNHV